MLKIKTAKNPVLHQKAQKIKKFDAKILKLAQKMTEIMLEENGVGIAAPQVGKSKQVIIINYEKKLYTLGNPEIKKKSKLKIISKEGCLSVPGVEICLKRYKEVEVSAINKDNQKIKIQASGMLAIILQHEIDHLKGILITDYIQKAEREKLFCELEKRGVKL